MSEELPSQYDPKEVEGRLYDFWMKLGVFEPDPKSKKKPYVITMPPPNVTGVLHMGHALTNTIEDILIRRKRMQGFDALWVPGTDHAGIATQMVVERNLMKEEKKSRHDLGREAFLKKVWEWKELSQGTILGQLKRLGVSSAWSRLKFTLDEDVSLAVRETFVRLYNEKLIFRDTSIIQWCPRCHTALSDLEVKFQEKKSKLWSIRYVSTTDPKKYIVVATTRPETLLGDTAVAVNPKDDRYKAWHGKKVFVPLINREIPIITDDYVDMTFGTGALKITPGHDPNDYLVGKKHSLAVITIFDESAVLNDKAGPYKGLNRDKGREKVLADLTEKGLLEGEKDHVNNVGHCDRCQTVVEPLVSRQWFVDAATLAKPAIKAVESKEIRIIPEEWEKTYFNWMYNIHPWCISRQLWWGHRIPVWYCQKCASECVAVETPTKCTKCGASELKQDEDVLDTWFSSGLWPFSTLGWPKKTADLERYYPTDVMETGFDILFFWVARMIMLGIKMTGKIPFHTVYLHPMVRDEQGQKMSKTKGNVVDPLEIVKTMGADSLRFFFAANAYHGRDVRVADSQLESARNFVNKIWNASRFVLMHFSDVKKENIDTKNPINQWIWTSLNRTKEEVNKAFDEYRFFDAAKTLYHFLWDQYCFWFIEFIKQEGELKERKEKKESTAVNVLEEVLRLLHPIMPFMTEEIWQKIPLKSAEKSISTASYPTATKDREFEENYRRVEKVCEIINVIRAQRGVYNVPPSKEIEVTISPNGDASQMEELKPFSGYLQKLGKVSQLHFVSKDCDPSEYVGGITPFAKVYLKKADVGGTEDEKKRKQKELFEKEAALQRAEEKLRNPRFTENAPPKVRDGVVQQRDELSREVTALKQYLGLSK